MYESDLRPVGYPKTDGYPKECPRKLWDVREKMLRPLMARNLGNEVKVARIVSWTKENLGIKCSGAEVRKFLKTMLDHGYPVGSNDRGYYYGKYRGEMQSTIDQLVGRRMKIDERIQVASHINRSLPERK